MFGCFQLSARIISKVPAGFIQAFILVVFQPRNVTLNMFQRMIVSCFQAMTLQCLSNCLNTTHTIQRNDSVLSCTANF